MYLSLLRLNPRSRKAMTEASRPYELHRSLMRAFPSYDSSGAGRILFRLDIEREKGGMSILVQSEEKPEWTALTGSGDFLLEEPQCKPFNPTIPVGKLLYFRLRANPTVKRNGKRLGILREEDQIEWLRRKGKEGGFEIVSLTVMPESIAHDKMTDHTGTKHNISLFSVRLEGVLTVTDENKFEKSLKHGIGSGKGLGFGLISIAPITEE